MEAELAQIGESVESHVSGAEREERQSNEDVERRGGTAKSSSHFPNGERGSNSSGSPVYCLRRCSAGDCLI